VPTELPDSYGEDALSRRAKIILYTTMWIGVVLAGFAFVYKVTEFIFTLTSSEVPGFATVPVTVYFAVAGGWLALLVWAYLSGQFTNVEHAKLEMLEQEAEYERRGE
jgi:hypothetical protein